MADIVEIYADRMVKFSVSRDGKIVKLVLASERPGAGETVEVVPTTILTMPASSMEAALSKISDLLQSMKSAREAVKN